MTSVRETEAMKWGIRWPHAGSVCKLPYFREKQKLFSLSNFPEILKGNFLYYPDQVALKSLSQLSPFPEGKPLERLNFQNMLSENFLQTLETMSLLHWQQCHWCILMSPLTRHYYFRMRRIRTWILLINMLWAKFCLLNIYIPSRGGDKQL